jgi:hypothetical protein
MDDFLRVAAENGGSALAAFLAEGFERERLPDYRVTSLDSAPWSAPVGRLVTGEGEVLFIGEEGNEDDVTLGLDPAAREEDGHVTVEITDPGWYRRGDGEAGSVRREARAPAERLPGLTDLPEGFFESVARLEGPAWDHLPVDVEFLFEDGIVVRDAWDGRAAWRDYRFVRPARLARVRIDPARTIQLDVWPQNNGRTLHPDGRFAGRWAAWFMGVAQWAAAGASMWL